MRGMGRMKDNGYRSNGAGTAQARQQCAFAYFCGPDEVPIEYTFEGAAGRRRLSGARLGYWFPPGRSDQWGITQPRSARYYRAAAVRIHDDGWRL
jgi:catechol 2,3-dioxygenase